MDTYVFSESYKTDTVRADGVDSQTKNVLAKLDGLLECAKAEKRVGSFKMALRDAGRALLPGK
eukprot:SAG22_NODE_680_length_7934_cov_5.365539_4_plen_63_part_00